jgi:hypothetical protein
MPKREHEPVKEIDPRTLATMQRLILQGSTESKQSREGISPAELKALNGMIALNHADLEVTNPE